VHVAGHAGKGRGQDAEPRPHLEHYVLGSALQLTQNDAQNVVVDQEVLPQIAFRLYAELDQPGQRDLAQRPPGTCRRSR
jgi:hypothetical protein